jgi:hypothetical protein
MITDPRTLDAFFSELEKIGLARQMMRIAKTRKGRRPISVAKLLKLDAAGKLFKRASLTGDLGAAFDVAEQKTKRRLGKNEMSRTEDSKLDEGRDSSGLVAGLGGAGEWATPTGRVT